MVLLDSGAQYTEGTTDVTRTFHLGTPSDWERESFTRVLKGNIGPDTTIFPSGTPGMAIDAFARTALWQAGLDYLHGTGHGVGAALNVHEGPISISARYGNTHGLQPGERPNLHLSMLAPVSSVDHASWRLPAPVQPTTRGRAQPR